MAPTLQLWEKNSPSVPLSKDIWRWWSLTKGANWVTSHKNSEREDFPRINPSPLLCGSKGDPCDRVTPCPAFCADGRSGSHSTGSLVHGSQRQLHWRWKVCMEGRAYPKASCSCFAGLFWHMHTHSEQKSGPKEDHLQKADCSVFK